MTEDYSKRTFELVRGEKSNKRILLSDQKSKPAVAMRYDAKDNDSSAEMNSSSDSDYQPYSNDVQIRSKATRMNHCHLDESFGQKKVKKPKRSRNSVKYEIREKRVEQRKEKSRFAAQKRRNIESSIINMMQLNLGQLMQGRCSPFHYTNRMDLQLFKNILCIDPYEMLEFPGITEIIGKMVAASHIEKSAVIKLTAHALFFYHHLHESLRISSIDKGIRQRDEKALNKLVEFPSVESQSILTLLVDASTMTIVYATPALAALLGWPWINLIGTSLNEILPAKGVNDESLSRISALRRICTYNTETSSRFHPYCTDENNPMNNIQIENFWCSNLYRQSSSRRTTILNQKFTASINSDKETRPVFDTNFYNRNLLLNCWVKTSFQTKYLRPMKLLLFNTQPFTLTNSQVRKRILHKDIESSNEFNGILKSASQSCIPLMNEHFQAGVSASQEAYMTQDVINCLNYIEDGFEKIKSGQLLVVVDNELKILFHHGQRSETFSVGCNFLDYVSLTDLQMVVNSFKKFIEGDVPTSAYPISKIYLKDQSIWVTGIVNIMSQDTSKRSGTRVTLKNLIILLKPIMHSDEVQTCHIRKSNEKTIDVTNVVIEEKVPIIQTENKIRRPRKQSMREKSLLNGATEQKVMPKDEILSSLHSVDSNHSFETFDSMLTSESNILGSLISTDINDELEFFDSHYNLDLNELSKEADEDFLASTKEILNEYSSELTWLQPKA